MITTTTGRTERSRRRERENSWAICQNFIFNNFDFVLRVKFRVMLALSTTVQGFRVQWCFFWLSLPSSILFSCFLSLSCCCCCCQADKPSNNYICWHLSFFLYLFLSVSHGNHRLCIGSWVYQKKKKYKPIIKCKISDTKQPNIKCYLGSNQ